MVSALTCCLALIFSEPDFAEPVVVRIVLNDSAEINVSEVVRRLAEGSSVPVARQPAALNLPTVGLAAPLTRSLLGDTLGPDARIEFEAKAVVVTLDPRIFESGNRAEWERRLRDLSDRAGREVERRSRYGIRARPSYRANDPTRPTVCLIHGLNSTSGVFKHMIGPIEAAGVRGPDLRLSVQPRPRRDLSRVWSRLARISEAVG